MKRAQLFAVLLMAALSSLSCGRISAAQRATEELLARKVSRCGGSFYTLRALPKETPAIYELKDFDWEIQATRISEVDRLNGVTFRGLVAFSWSAHRDTLDPKSRWSQWKGYEIWIPFPKSVEVLEKDKRWIFPFSLYDQFKDFNAVSCADLDKISAPSRTRVPPGARP